MKKILPKIFIALIIVNLFAPFTLGLSTKGNPIVSKSVAEAADMNVESVQTKRTSNSIDVSIKITNRKVSDHHKLFYVFTDNSGVGLKTLQKSYVGVTRKEWSLSELVEAGLADSELKSYDKVFDLPSGVKDLNKDSNGGGGLPGVIEMGSGTGETQGSLGSDYRDLTKKVVLMGLSPSTTYYLSIWGYNGDATPYAITPSNLLNQSFTTTAVGEVDNTATTISSGSTSGPDGSLPACWLGFSDGGISMSGCIAQGVYYGLFIPTSYLFALTGLFFDSTFAYSVNDASYRSPFVVEGWGVVRDFVNIFFIFVLIYIAFATILSLHGFKTKEMIVNVVIIGLLMNFSLFAAQLIIDGSNILARVFYNSNAIKITEKGANGVTNNTPGLTTGPNGELPLSAALVNKVNPQTLIINASSVTTLEDKGGRSSGEIDKVSGVSNGTFILIIILAIAINIVGMIVFLSVGLIFVARVVGLWIYMILAPFAFFSYTVPQMQGLEMVGWKKWWPEVLSLSFVAPIFIFFLYLILKFLETGLSLISAGSKTGLQFVISVVVPFAFIMILLWKAKGIATKMSGEIGQSITGGIAAIGGIALGGAALGAAFAGRTVIGKTMGLASQTDSSKHLGKYKAELRDFKVKDKEHAVKMKVWRAGGSIGQRPTAPVAPRAPISGEHLGYDKKGNAKYYKPGIITSLGASLNAKQSRIEKADHEAHELEATKDKRYKGTDWKDLSGTQQNNVREDYIKDNRGKHAAEAEETFRNDSARNGTGGVIASNIPLTPAQRKTVTDDTTKITGHKFDHIVEEASKSISSFSRNLSKVNTASFDARNISQMKSSGRGNFVTRNMGKISAGLIAGVAMGVRTGLKGSGINHGSGQNDFLKDIGHTITEAMKSAKINVKVEESHGKGGGDEHKGAGGHH